MLVHDIEDRVEIVRISVLEVAANILNDTLRKVPCEASLIV